MDVTASPRGFEKSLEQRAAEQIHAAIVADVRLRQWCIERAIEYRCLDLIESGTAIFEFITNMPPKIESKEPANTDDIPYDPRN